MKKKREKKNKSKVNFYIKNREDAINVNKIFKS